MAWDIVKKITAMVAKAEATSSLEEAETIMTMVRKMLDQHGITLLSISEAEARSADPVGTSRDVYGFWQSDSWMRRLAEAAAAYYGVRAVYRQEGNYNAIAIVGRESCRAAFTAMLPYLRLRVARLARNGYNNHLYPSNSRAKNMIGNALAHRLLALSAARYNEEKAATGKVAAGANALVPLDDMEIEMREQFPKARTVNPRNITVRTSKQAIEDAASVDLNTQINAVDMKLRVENKG